MCISVNSKLNYLFSQFSCSVVSDSLWPHEPQHTRPPCPSPTPGVYPNPCPLSRWCHPTISSSVIPFSSCPQSFPASGSFPMSQLFTSNDQSIGVSVSTSFLPTNTQDWSLLGWSDWISSQSKGLSGVFSNTRVEKHQFFSSVLSFLYSPTLTTIYFPGDSDVKASAYNTGDLGSIPGSGRSPGEGNGNPLQYSCLKNPMDRGAW